MAQGFKDFEFELEGGTLELELRWMYEYTPAFLDGLPENCHPEEEECEVLAPVDIAARVKAHAERMISIWTKQIESKCMDLEYDNAPREWAQESAEY